MEHALIRPAVPDDAEAIGRIHVAVWQHAYAGLLPQQALDELDPVARGAWWRKGLITGAASAWVAVRGGEIVGFAGAGPAVGEPEITQLYTLYVLPEHHGTGVAGPLTAAAIGDGPALLNVLDGNARAIRFYEKIGFRFDGHTSTERLFGIEVVEHRMIRD
ncbi:GNAT family N-acetyltransferase [Microbacterium sediminis]|uniref:GNAT family N-acetyltransferase n=1 Tax=Microbacterium sediminis TaxID=904291 RepID=UPI0010720297|nr:GNAT family N-acetyltransferase [Microbacterium sediminis]QBR75018.1 GNAT family N-acetyltransferase [Microbacterium sediminis]